MINIFSGSFFIQEIITAIFIVINTLLSGFGADKSGELASKTTLYGLLATACSFSFTSTAGASDCNLFIQTPFTILFKIIIIVCAIFTVIFTGHTKHVRYKTYEYYNLILAAVFAAMMLVSAQDFTVVFVCGEILSISCFWLISYKNKKIAKETAFKYFVTSTVATGFLLAGISYIYAICGELNFSVLQLAYFPGTSTPLFNFAQILVLTGLTMKIGCLPFSNILPNICEGTTFPICAFLTTVPVAAGFGITAQICSGIFSGTPSVGRFIILLSIITIFFGYVSALGESSAKRFLTHLAIADCGFLLAALGNFSTDGIAALIFGTVCHVIAVFGAWCVAYKFFTIERSDKIGAYAGTAKNYPLQTAAFTVFLTALIGFPPTSGFWAKIFLFLSVISPDGSGIFALIPLLLLIPVGFFSYIKILKIFFEKPSFMPILKKQRGYGLIPLICAVLTTAIFLLPETLKSLANTCAAGI